MNTRTDRTILVTGASTGIGRAATLALLEAGFQVFAAVRNEQAAQELRDGLAADALARLRTIELDVTRPEQIRAAVAAIDVAVGERGLWGLFNNAGISVTGPIEYVSLERFRHQFEVNVFGQIAVTQACLPLLRRARGRIVNTGSIAGFFSAPALAPYSMSKFAMRSFSDALRRELRPWGISVSLLEPGAIATEIWRKGLSASDATRNDPPPGLVENYGGLVEGLQRVARRTAAGASPVGIVTQAVLHAFTASRPKTCYRMGSGAASRKFISRLPDRLSDWLVAKGLRWG